MLRTGEVAESVHEHGADLGERMAQAAAQQVAGAADHAVRVVEVLSSQFVVVAAVEPGALAFLGADGGGLLGEGFGRNGVALQVRQQTENAVGEAARVGDAGKVRQGAAVGQLRDEVLRQQPPLHGGQRPGGRVVGADDLVQNILKGVQPRTADGERFFGQSAAQGGPARKVGASQRTLPAPSARRRMKAFDHALRLAGSGRAAENVYRRGHIRGPWSSARTTGPRTHYSVPRPPTQRTMQRQRNGRPSIAADDRHT